MNPDTLRPWARASSRMTAASAIGTVTEKLLVFRVPDIIFLIYVCLLCDEILWNNFMSPRKPSPQRLPKHHAGQVRKTVSLSFSAPIELEEPMNQMAARRGMSRSQYICWLVMQHLYLDRGQLPPLPIDDALPALPKMPPRVRRKLKQS